MELKKSKHFLLVVLLAMVATLFLTACSPSLTDASVQVNDNVRYQDFSIETAVIVFTYSDGSIKTQNVTKEMLSAEDVAKLSQPGKHKLTINYAKRKSVQVEINLLRDSEDNIVLNQILQGLQKAAPGSNINGELEASVYYILEGQPRKDYSLSLKFTLDVDKGAGSENYLGLEVTENGNVVMAIYYKDDTATQSRPYIYIKSGGPLTAFLGETQNKFPCVSVDDYFGEAKTPADDELWEMDNILGMLMSFVDDKMVESMVELVLDMIFTNAAVADDGSATAINIDLTELVSWLPLVFLAPDISKTANDFLSSLNAGANIFEVISGIASPTPLLVKTIYDGGGGLKSLDITDKDGNTSIKNALHIKLDKKLEAGLNIDKISIKADDTAFSLPDDKGLNNWEESSVSFERWALLQYRRILGNPAKPPILVGLREYLDIDYVGDSNPYHLLDIYRPDNNLDNLPVIINIHGGGWVHGVKEDTYNYCQHLAQQGFAVVNINYHLLPDARMPVPMQDVFAAFNFVMDDGNAQQYGFDNQNAFLTGDSAGGHYAMLALSILADPQLAELYGVSPDISFRAAGVSSTGFTFTDVLKLPIPFAHFYVNQFFSDDLPYTAYKDDPRYIDMAKSLNLENNMLENFPPMFVSSAHGDLFKSHSDRLVHELKERGVQYLYDFRNTGDKDNRDNFFLGHDFNVAAPGWPISKVVNNKMCDFFKTYVIQ